MAPTQAIFDFPGQSDFEIVLDPENDGPKAPKPLLLKCDHCGEGLRIPKRWVGAPGFCGHCGEKFVVPHAAPEQPADSIAAYQRAATLVESDPEACEESLLVAAKTKHTEALYALGHLHMLGASRWRIFFNRSAKRRDYTKAIEWFVQAADHGHARSQLALGFMYFRGMGARKERARAFMWFSLAAQRGEKVGEQHAKAMWHRMKPHELEAANLMIERWYEARES